MYDMYSRSAKSIPSSVRKQSGGLPLFLEFFAGSGLVTEGMKGYFKVAWANDISEKKAAVYCANHGSKRFHLGSITEVEGKNLPWAPMAWASFPCQDLSLAGQIKGIHASRSGLVWEWLRVIDEMPKKPLLLVAENVAGLVSAGNGIHYQALHDALSERGYRCGVMLLDASHWVPQSRPRVFVVAIAKNMVVPINLISSHPNWTHSASIRTAVASIPDNIWWNIPQPPKRKLNLSDIIEWDAEQKEDASDNRNRSLISPKHQKTVESYTSSQRLVFPGYKRTRNGKQVLELRFDNTAGCLRTPRGGSSRQVIVIKDGDKLSSRLLTVRETARLMGAPDRYKLPGNYNDGYMAMGDAVAVPVVKWLTKYLLFPLVKANDNN